MGSSISRKALKIKKKNCSVQDNDLLAKLKILGPNFSFVWFPCAVYYYRLCPSTCPTSKNHMNSDLTNEAIITSLLFCHKKHCKHRSDIFAVFTVAPSCWKKAEALSLSDWCSKAVSDYRCVSVVSEKRISPIVLAALAVQPTVTWHHVMALRGLIVMPTPLFWEVTYLHSWNQA